MKQEKEKEMFNSSRANVVFVGMTGVGKSYIISQICDVKEKIDSSSKESFTVSTDFYPSKTNINIKPCNVADTPGLCDSNDRDQQFIDSFVNKLTFVAETTGLHRLYYVLDSGRTRFDGAIQNGIRTIKEIFARAISDQSDTIWSVFKILINPATCPNDPNAKSDCFSDWENILQKNAAEFELIDLTGGIKNLIDDINKIDLKVTISTDYMDNIQTMKTQLINYQSEIEDLQNLNKTLNKEKEKLEIQKEHLEEEKKTLENTINDLENKNTEILKEMQNEKENHEKLKELADDLKKKF